MPADPTPILPPQNDNPPEPKQPAPIRNAGTPRTVIQTARSSALQYGAPSPINGVSQTYQNSHDSLLFVVDAGDTIQPDPDKASATGGIGIHYGPPYVRPPNGHASGRNAITPIDDSGNPR